MKTILIIIGKLYIGGAERVGRDIGYYADKNRFKIHYIVFEDDIGPYEEELIEEGCVIHHLDPPSKGYIAYYLKLIEIIRQNHIDVIHSHTMYSSGWAMLAGKKCGVPIRIAHSHTTKGPEKRGMIKNSYEKIMRKVIRKYATRYIGCGRGAGIWLFGKEFFEKNGEIIYNGIDLTSYHYNPGARDKIRDEYHLDNAFLIGHVGHLATVKNQMFLIDMMPEILQRKANAVLLLLGDGPDRELLETAIKDRNIEKYVLMTGNVNNVGEFMSAMDVFVFPSLYEGMPLAMIEAQTNGLPCLISDRIPDDIHLTDLVKSLSLDDKKEWIKDIIDSCRNNGSDYGSIMCQMGFDSKVMLKKIYKLYEGC